MGMFFILPYMLCAAITSALQQDFVALGQLIDGECQVAVLVGDSHGQTSYILGHDIGVDILSGGRGGHSGANIYIDGVGFYVAKP